MVDLHICHGKRKVEFDPAQTSTKDSRHIEVYKWFKTMVGSKTDWNSVQSTHVVHAMSIPSCISVLHAEPLRPSDYSFSKGPATKIMSTYENGFLAPRDMHRLSPPPPIVFVLPRKFFQNSLVPRWILEGPAPSSKSGSACASRGSFLISNLTDPKQKSMTSLKRAKKN